MSHIGSQVKRRQSQSYKFKEFAKISNFWISKQALHATHPLKLLDKMCKYEMDPMSIVEDTEQTRFCPQTDRRTDGQGETSIPSFQLRWSGGYNEWHICAKSSFSTAYTAALIHNEIPDSIVYWANMGPSWGRQDPAGPHVGPMNLVIWDDLEISQKFQWPKSVISIQ